MGSERTIVLKGEPLQFEDLADAAITPGFLIEITATGVKKHATKGGAAAPMFAIENSLEGDEIGTDYDAGDRVQYVHARSGDEILAYLADGEDVTKGSFLCSNGNGYLQKATPASSDFDDSTLIAIALEALTLSTSAAGATRVQCRII